MVKRTAGDGWVEQGGEIARQALDRLAKIKGRVRQANFEEGVSELAEVLRGGKDALFAQGGAQMAAYLKELECETDGSAWAMGLMALEKSGALAEIKSKAVARMAYQQMMNALSWESREKVEKLTRACFCSEGFLLAFKGSAEETVAGFVDSFCSALDAGDDATESMAILEEALGAAERVESLRGAGPGGTGKGLILLSMCKFHDVYEDVGQMEVFHFVAEKAEKWMEAGMNLPGQGVVAGALCESLKEASVMMSPEGAQVVVRLLKKAMALGLGVRQAGSGAHEGPKPLKVMLGIHPRSQIPSGLMAEAAQALLDAGATEADLLMDLGNALKNAPNRELANRVSAMMERRELLRSLGDITAEEMEMIRVFRRERMERKAPEQEEASSEVKRRARL